MAQSVTIAGASYSDVPSITVPKQGGGSASFVDTSDADAVAADVAQGKTCYVDGVKIVGTGGGGQTTVIVVPEQTKTVSSAYTQITNYTEAIIEGEEYIVTVNGGTNTFTAVNQYGSVYVGYTPAILIEWTGTQMYFDVMDSSLYGTYTIKLERITGGGGSTLIEKSITANGVYNASDDSADGYSKVTVSVSGGSSKNVQTSQTTDRRNNTALGSINSLTCSTAGTYDVYWTCARSNTSQTWGSQLYIGGSSYGTENTTWTNNVQTNHLENVSISANQTVAVYGRSRSGYYIYAPQLTIVQK